jgi:siroheme synthase
MKIKALIKQISTPQKRQVQGTLRGLEKPVEKVEDKEKGSWRIKEEKEEN